MQLSKRNLNQNLEKQIQNLFYQLIADLNTPKEAKIFLESLLTKIEVKAIVKRLAIAYYLNQGRDYQSIRNNLSVSSRTIATIREKMKENGIKVALKKIQAEEWADKWSKRIGKVIKFKIKK